MATPWMIRRPGSKLGITQVDPGPAEDATIAAFLSGDFTCSITSATLTPTAGTATSEQPGTMCDPAVTVPLPSASTWTLDVSMLQDADDPAGISAYLLLHDGEEGWVYVSTGESDGFPKWVAHVYLSAAAIGGAPMTPLTADVSFRLIEKPDVAHVAGALMSRETDEDDDSELATSAA